MGREQRPGKEFALLLRGNSCLSKTSKQIHIPMLQFGLCNYAFWCNIKQWTLGSNYLLSAPWEWKLSISLLLSRQIYTHTQIPSAEWICKPAVAHLIASPLPLGVLREEGSSWEVKTSAGGETVFMRAGPLQPFSVSCETRAAIPELWERFVMSGGEASVRAWERVRGGFDLSVQV